MSLKQGNMNKISGRLVINFYMFLIDRRDVTVGTITTLSLPPSLLPTYSYSTAVTSLKQGHVIENSGGLGINFYAFLIELRDITDITLGTITTLSRPPALFQFYCCDVIKTGSCD